MTINYQYSYLIFLAFSVGACSGMAPEAYPPGAERVPSSTEEAVSADSAWQDSPGEEPSSTLTDLSGPAARPSYEPGTIEIDANGFIINGEYTYLRGGTVQYFKIPQSSWRDRLQRFKAAGFNTIDLYVAWNLHEPESGVYDFETHDLAHFLELAHEYGLYVYLRPGPYFTNEWNGGGLPSWLNPIATKDSTDEDGLVNFRTQDPDYLYYVERYFNKLNEVVRPYLITRGGPIILYSVENEYDYFDLYFHKEQQEWIKDGFFERNIFSRLDVTKYFEGLRDIVEDDGIDVPIATCPGQAAVLSTGNVERIIPMPNIYKPDQAEKRAYDTIVSMHDPEQFDGVYTNMPSGSTETDRTASRMKRLFMGGMDGFFAFNIAGSHQEGRNNSITLIPGEFHEFFDWKVENLPIAFMSPRVGYFHNVTDFYGAISPSGILREKFYHFRRANLFFNAFETTFAALERPLKSGPSCKDATGDSFWVDHPTLGAAEGEEDQEKDSRCHYSMKTDSGSTLFSIVNETRDTQVLQVGSVQVDGITMPQFKDWTVPVELFPAEPGEGGIESIYTYMGVTRLPITESLTLQHTTSDILTLQPFNQETLLVLFGAEGTDGEVVFEADGWAPLTEAAGFEAQDAGEGKLGYTYRYDTPKDMRLTNADGDILRIVVTTTHLAGRTWFVGDDAQAMVMGPDFLALDHAEGTMQMEMLDASRMIDVWSREELRFDDWTLLEGFDAETGRARYGFHAWDVPRERPALQATKVQVATTPAEAMPDVYDWMYLGDDLVPLEELDILKGTVWYEATVDIPWWMPLSWFDQLWVDEASDFVRIYVNGEYVTTVCPLGTEINNHGWLNDYQFRRLSDFLQHGENTISFQVSVWGHGSFMFPKGRYLPGRLKLPAAGYDAFKGLIGEAWVGWWKLRDWRVRPEPQAMPNWLETEELAAPESVRFSPGSVATWEGEFLTDELPNPERFFAPTVLELKGEDLFAEVFINGRHIGRWISDVGWLYQGSFVRPVRDMWMNTDPDHFPVAPGVLHQDGTPNQVKLYIQEMSQDREDPGGILESVKLVSQREDRLWKDGSSERVERFWWRSRL